MNTSQEPKNLRTTMVQSERARIIIITMAIIAWYKETFRKIMVS